MPKAQYPMLLSPFTVGSLRLKNRAVFSAHLTNMAENHLLSAKQAHYYEERAKGGAGLIITEEVTVHPSDWAYEHLIDAYLPQVVKGYRYTTNLVHRHGAKIFLQLNHNGSQGDSIYSRAALWAPSVSIDPLYREAAKAIDLWEIEELISYFSRAAIYAREGGFDGVELQSSHSSILRQFLSPYSNRRDDQYGGSLENRFRLVERVGAAVRAAIGPNLALGLRLSGEEFVSGGLTLADTVEISRLAQQCGHFDYLNFSTGIATRQLYLVEGTMTLPPAYSVYITEAVRGEVGLPIIACGRIKDPRQAEKILAQGQADLIGMVRAQISDPYFMKKTLAGEEEQINGCLSCNQDCIGRVGTNKEIGCVQNPYIGREAKWDAEHIPLSAKTKKVVVVGAGPAGLEAAIVAAKRGHKVLLLEKSGRTGGRIPLAASLPHRAELGESIRNLDNTLKLLPVELRLNTEVTADMIRAQKPQYVIIATGASVKEHYLRNDQPHIYNLADWLLCRAELGRRVLIIDLLGSYAAASTLELLLQMGKEAELICGALQPAAGLSRTTDYELWVKRVKQAGAILTTDASVLSVNGKDISVMDNYSGAKSSRCYDNVLISAPLAAENSLYYEIKQDIPAALVGDALAPRGLGEAIYDGFEAAIGI